MTARLEDTVEVYENLSLKPEALNYAPVKAAKSDLIQLEVLPAPKAAAAPAKEEAKDKKEAAPAAPAKTGITPYELCGGTGDELVLALVGGSDGAVLAVTPDAYLGQDNGPGKRTGLQAFLENSTVSILAIPGVTAPEVQAALIGFCESRKSCFAILDVPIEYKKTNDVANFRDMYRLFLRRHVPPLAGDVRRRRQAPGLFPALGRHGRHLCPQRQRAGRT